MSIFKSLLKTFNRIRSGIKEREHVQLDDYVLEHFLLYHGLVGSMPENQRDYKDVRADVIEAVNHNSAEEMSIALKIPPLWWEDRLYKIMDEVVTANKEGAINCLLPLHLIDDIDSNKFPLKHSDWRVRANTARLLARLELTDAVPYLVQALQDTAVEQRPAFCHIAYSLAKLQTEEARKGLSDQLYNDEPWFRVDAAGALANWPAHAVAHDLMRTILYDSELIDYMSVAIARKLPPSQLLEMQDDEIDAGVAEMICGLLRAINGPFHAEAGLTETLTSAADQLNIVTGLRPTPRLLNATISLNLWLHKNTARTSGGSSASSVYTLTDLSNDAHKASVMQALSKRESHPVHASQQRHAIELAGTCNLQDARPLLVAMVRDDFSLLTSVIESLGRLKATEAAVPIIALLEKKLPLQSRWSGTLSKHPIAESDKGTSVLYWTALKALGNMPGNESFAFLLKAVNDIAPDMREEALLSLSHVAKALGEQSQALKSSEITELLRERLGDPAPQVRSAALKAVASQGTVELLSDSLKLINAPEVSIQRQCAETMESLASAGYRDQVVSATKSAISKEIDGARRERLHRLLSSL